MSNPRFENAQSMNATSSQVVNLVLQGNGGLGKSLVATLLAQFYKSKGHVTRCIDTDPVNHSNASFVIDNGAATFIPLWHCMSENSVVRFLREAKRRLLIHTVRRGGRDVYDIATGLYLLIPQGSRLVGRDDSHVAYGKDGVQIARSRIIYPDASSVDLDGTMGPNSHGNAGLRDKVDRHYLRIVGLSVLTSMFTAAFEIFQRSSQSDLTNSTPTQTAGSAIGQELSQTGAQITRRNLNVQPTIKVFARYKFTVRVNCDILFFEAPYEPVHADSEPKHGRATTVKEKD